MKKRVGVESGSVCQCEEISLWGRERGAVLYYIELGDLVQENGVHPVVWRILQKSQVV